MGELFNNGFEEGDFTAWTSNTGGTVVNETKHHGTWCYKTTTNVNCKKITAGSTSCYARVYVKFSGYPSANTYYVRFMTLARAASVNYASLALYNSNGTYKWMLTYYGGSGDHTVYSDMQTNPATNTWVCLELYYKRDVVGNDGACKVWINGSELTDISQTNFDGPSSDVNELACWHIVSNGDQFTVYHDCVVISDAYIGPESSGYSPKTRSSLPNTMMMMLNSKMLYG